MKLLMDPDKILSYITDAWFQKSGASCHGWCISGWNEIENSKLFARQRNWKRNEREKDPHQEGCWCSKADDEASIRQAIGKGFKRQQPCTFLLVEQARLSVKQCKFNISITFLAMNTLDNLIIPHDPLLFAVPTKDWVQDRMKRLWFTTTSSPRVQ